MQISHKIVRLSDFLSRNYPKKVQIFRTPGIDPTRTVYDADGIIVEDNDDYISPYVEISGLTDDEYSYIVSKHGTKYSGS